MVLAVILGSFSCPAEARQRRAKQVPAGAIACHFVATAFLNGAPASQYVYQGEVVGYFTSITGVGGSDRLLNGKYITGQCNDKTAVFTFRALFSSIALLKRGNSIGFILSPGTFDIYYNKNPAGEWSNPESFSAGQQIARYIRPVSLFSGLWALAGHVASLTQDDAGDHFGQVATVCGVVALTDFDVDTQFRPRFPRFGKPYPAQVFTAAFLGIRST
jgi:hypothetical protein